MNFPVFQIAPSTNGLAKMFPQIYEMARVWQSEWSAGERCVLSLRCLHPWNSLTIITPELPVIQMAWQHG